MKDKEMDFDEGCRLLDLLDRQCYIKGDYIVLNVRFPYDIELSRCTTYKKIIHWAWHLGHKNWVYPALLSKFIELCCKYHNLELDE